MSGVSGGKAMVGVSQQEIVHQNSNLVVRQFGPGNPSGQSNSYTIGPEDGDHSHGRRHRQYAGTASPRRPVIGIGGGVEIGAEIWSVHSGCGLDVGRVPG